jgi:SAM-dependent methyltransferase
VFGRDPASYDRARLEYPPRVFEVLTGRCGLRRGTATFEIGPGTGKATRRLLELGANPLTVIEPNRRLADYLTGAVPAGENQLQLVLSTFEKARLPRATFDLGVAATSFHWLPQRSSLRKVARLLRSGGWWAEWGNLHGDPSRPDTLHQAMQPLYEELRPSPRRGTEAEPLSSVRLRRIELLSSLDLFDRIHGEHIHWGVPMTTDRIVLLWSTFSDITTLPARKRAWFLQQLRSIVEGQFNGRVVLRGITPLFTARRR